ncbi:hypothetical protein CC80DRAFT_546451 [Byssothecium circinans]|uniref:Uncharacterized protein n=1 Tax=Byssothecium circinans TaxID=147558 RepID=A0A6A5U0T2_9PLEO|nr:hypothetical protein CC80DRAFT_546451 [Byssothecium circinans]
MATLFDLPSELLKKIVHELIRTAGIHKTWRKRGTCRVFANEIQHNIFALQPNRVFNTIIEHKVWLLVFHRSKTMLQPRSNMYLGKVNEMIDWIAHEVGIAKDGEDDVREIVCKALVKAIGNSPVFDIFVQDDGPSDLYSSAKCAAEDCGDIFGDLLACAAEKQDLNVVKVISNHIETLPATGKAVFANRYMGMLFDRPLIHAIQLRDTNMIDALLALRNRWTSKLVPKPSYNDWLIAAISSDSLDQCSSWMDFFCDPSTPSTPGGLDLLHGEYETVMPSSDWLL